MVLENRKYVCSCFAWGFGLFHIILFNLFSPSLAAQNGSLADTELLISNQRQSALTLEPQTWVTLDSQSIVPGSVILSDKNAKALSEDSFEIDWDDAQLRWLGTQAVKVNIQYRVFGGNWEADLQLISRTALDSQGNFTIKPWFEKNQGSNLWGMGALEYDGNFSRGISFGNNQDVVLNSQFNLQLKGELGDGVFITAALTDNNVPIQPEGNTQNLQEFDRIFIQLEKDRHRGIIGDFDLPNPKSHFLTYNRKVQGLLYQGGNILERGKLEYSASASISRGKFRRQQLQTQEGNQGPYKLRGNDGEQFIIVLAGSERVYLNGQVLKRGQENDYTINYNSGEIQFMPRRLITKDVRIQVDFEYSDRRFLRSLISSSLEWKMEKWEWKWDLFSEQDAKGQPVNDSFSNAEINLLQTIGDSLNQAFFSGIDTVEFDPDRILYRRTDSLGYSIFVYSTDPDSAIFALQFSDVGFGNGNYLLESNLANGRVYKWIEPLGGLPQGNFEPIRVLVTPKLKQVNTIGTRFKINANNSISAEYALSRDDQNTFSKIDDTDDFGHALRFNYKRKQAQSPHQWNAFYELRQEAFSPVRDYRSVEFTRDWNLQTVQDGDEQMAGIGFQFEKENQSLGFETSGLLKGEAFMGLRQVVLWKWQNSQQWTLRLGGSNLNAREDSLTSHFLAPEFELSKVITQMAGIKIGVGAEFENNKRQWADSLLNGSSAFDNYRLFIESADSNQFSYRASWDKRQDRLPLLGVWKSASQSNDFKITQGFRWGKGQSFSSELGYRTLKVQDSILVAGQDEQNLVGRLRHQFSSPKKWFRGNWFYEVGSGLEPERAYSYQEVPSGQGNFTWKDYNGNGIKELDEFEVATFADEADYIRVVLPSENLISVVNSRFKTSLDFDPRLLFKATKNAQKETRPWWSFLALRSNIQFSKQLSNGETLDALNPFDLDLSNPLLSASSQQLRNTLFINRGAEFWTSEISHRNSKSRNLLLSGNEDRQQDSWQHRVQFFFGKFLSIENGLEWSKKSYLSQSFSTKTYDYSGFAWDPSMTLQWSNQFRSTLSFGYQEKIMIPDLGSEKSFENGLKLDLNYNTLELGAFRGDFEWLNLRFSGLNNSPLAFVFLEGLREGENFLWNLSWDRTLANNLQMTLSYNGRNNEGAKAVHIGSASVRAIF